MKQYKVRASKAGEILTEPRTKSETLSKGVITHAKKWLKETLYKRKYFKGNKYTQKGNANEEEGVTLLSLYYGCWLDTNTNYRENDYMCGTCDINHMDYGIIDIKNSYSLDTFPMFETELPDKDYGVQVNVYQELYDNKKVNGKVAYVLTDLDDEALEQKIKWLQTDNEKQEEAILHVYGAENWKRVKDKFFPNAVPIEFVEIPNEKRVKIFEVPYNEEVIKKLKKRVVEIRKFVKEVVN